MVDGRVAIPSSKATGIEPATEECFENQVVMYHPHQQQQHHPGAAAGGGGRGRHANSNSSRVSQVSSTFLAMRAALDPIAHHI